jgi:hypothetical protein
MKLYLNTEACIHEPRALLAVRNERVAEEMRGAASEGGATGRK